MTHERGGKFGARVASKQPFAMLYFDVLDDGRLDRNAKDSYICVLRFADIYERTQEEKTRAELAAVMSMSPDSFDRGCKKLVACGYLDIERRIRPGTKSYGPSFYVLYDSRAARLERDLVKQTEALNAPTDESAGQGGRTQRRPQAGTSQALAADSGEGVRTQRQGSPHTAARVAADSGSNTYKREEIKTEKEEETPLAVGADTVRTARDDVTPPPAGEDLETLARATFSRISGTAPHYHRAPASVRRAMVLALGRALARGIGPNAIIVYTQRHGYDDTVPIDRHVQRLDHVMTMLQADIKAGTACGSCGHDPADPYGPICERCRPDYVDLTEQDLAELAAAKRFLGELDGQDG